ncbi:MAG: response regulator [Sporichthyaceae bacterium]
MGLGQVRCVPAEQSAALTAARIVVVDDDEDIRTVLTWQLEREGFVVEAVADGECALAVVARGAPDLVVLDLTLPGLSGLDVLALLRRAGGVPVILLTARSGEADRVAGLDLGADDYLVKPFSTLELAARIRSVLRRSQPAAPAVLDFGRLVVDLRAREVHRDGRRVQLTAKEFDVLACLAAAPRRAFTRAELLTAVWQSSPDWQRDSTVTEHVHRLRHKLEDDPARPRWICTVRGSGYLFEP